MNLPFLQFLELTRAHNELTNPRTTTRNEKEKSIDDDVESKNRSIPCFDDTRKEEGSPRHVVLSSVENVHLLSFFSLSLSPANATSNGPRPAVLWCPVFRLSVFVRLTSAFPPPLLRHDTRLCRRKTIMYRHNKLFLPSCSCKPSFPGPPTPAWTYFRRSTFFVSRTGRGGGGGGEERFLTKKRRKWKDRGEGGIVARTYDILLPRIESIFLVWNLEWRK